MFIPQDEIELKVLGHRRAKLARMLSGASALFAAGGTRPRNYAAAIYPYRAASHFLWVVGLQLRDAYVLLRDGDAILFVDPPGSDDVIWHGPVPSLTDLGKATGLSVRPME